jgi:hypothetical protein
MAARMGVDIAPRAIFGKPEMPELRAFGADRGEAAAALTACFNGLLTAFRKCPLAEPLPEPGLKHRPTQ